MTEMVEAYKIHSLVREISTRLQRQQAPTRHRFVQRLAGGEILVRRMRPTTVTKAVLLQHLDVIKQAAEEGKLEVRTMVGELVDLKTFNTEPSPKSKPLPTPPLDSVERDKTFEHGVGEHKPLFPEGGTPMTEAPPLSVRPPVMSDDEPIKVGGDPAKARAAEAKADKPRKNALIEKPAEKGEKK